MAVIQLQVLRADSLDEIRGLADYNRSSSFALLAGVRAYRFDPASMALDTGDGAALKPTLVVAGDPGRWLPAPELRGADGVSGSDGSDGDPGPAGPPGSGATFTAENKGGVTIYAGQPVSIHLSGTGVVLADADSAGLPCDGVATEDIAPTFSGVIMTEGTLVLPDWTDATGSATLAAKSVLYLSATAGLLVAAPDGGLIAQNVGREVKPDTLEVNIKVPILL